MKRRGGGPPKVAALLVGLVMLAVGALGQNTAPVKDSDASQAAKKSNSRPVNRNKVRLPSPSTVRPLKRWPDNV